MPPQSHRILIQRFASDTFFQTFAFLHKGVLNGACGTDLDETLARVARLGGEILVAPRAAAYESRFAIIADPTGGTIGLVEYVNSASLPSSP